MLDEMHFIQQISDVDFRSFADTSPNCALQIPGLLRHLFGLLPLKQHRCVQSTGPQSMKERMRNPARLGER